METGKARVNATVFSVETVISKYLPTNYLLITQQGHSNSPDDEHC